MIELVKSKLNKKELRVEEVDETAEEELNLKNKEKSRLHLDLNPKNIQKSEISSPVINYDLKNNPDNKEKNDDQPKKPKEWSDKEKSDLIKAVSKFPAGTSNRWSQISEFIGRPANECIQMEKQIRSNFNSSSHSILNANSYSQTKTNVLNYKEEPSISTKLDDGANVPESNETWSQEQQLALEKALKEIGKDIPNRWDRIAESVSNKTKVNILLF